MSERPIDVAIVDYDPEWPVLFAVERDRILAIAPEPLEEVHHIGSTAVPGLAAKPIIDILVVLNRFFSESELAALAAAGYVYHGENGIVGRQFFDRQGRLPVHVHAFLEDSPDRVRHLRFAEYLRSHPRRAKEYEALKRSLAEEYRLDRAAYTEAKTQFIRDTERLAGLEASDATC